MSFFELLKPSKWKSERWLYNIEKSHNFIESITTDSENKPKEKQFSWHVVGESNYQKNIKKVEKLKEKSDTATNTAILKYENNNPHDEKAVVVIMEGYIVGYLSREDARKFRKKINNLIKRNEIPDEADLFTCKAELIGGYINHNGQMLSYGVVVTLPFSD